MAAPGELMHRGIFSKGVVNQATGSLVSPIEEKAPSRRPVIERMPRASRIEPMRSPPTPGSVQARGYFLRFVASSRVRCFRFTATSCEIDREGSRERPPPAHGTDEGSLILGRRLES